MSGSARNFRSARDRIEERQPPTKLRKQKAYSGIERRSDSRVWSDFEENHSELPPREPLHGNRYVQKDDRRKLERERSPGFDRWGSENKSRSPSDSWDLPQRGKGMSQRQGQSRSRSRDRRMSRSRSRGRVRSRSRSRSRGRARDRSRSPFDVHRRVSYGTTDRSGTGMSSQPCKYFAAGMCRKGSRCNFFHPDNLGSRDGKYYENDLEPRRRSKLEYGDEVEFPDNYERGNRNVSADYDLKRQPIRSGKPFCKDFAVGKCHRDNCRFSHDDPTADDKWSDDRRGRNHDERMKSWNGPMWDDYNKISDSAKSSGWGEKLQDPTVGEKRGDDRRGHNLDEKVKSWNGPTWDDTKDTLEAAKSTGWGEGSVVNPRFHDHDPTAVENRGDDRRRRSSNEKSKEWNGPHWDDAKDTLDAAKSTGWGDISVGKTKFRDPVAAGHRGDDRRDHNLDKKTESWYEVKDTSDAAKSIGWGEGSVTNMKLEDIEKQTYDGRGLDFEEKTKSVDAPTMDDVKDISDTAKARGWGDGSGLVPNFHDLTAADERIIHESSQFQSHEIYTDVDEQKNLTQEAGALQTLIRESENSHNIVIIEDSSAVDEVKVSDQNGENMSSQPLPASTIVDYGGDCLISSNGHNIDLNVPFQNMNPETESETLRKETGKLSSFQNNPETESETLPKETGKPSSEISDIGAPGEVPQNAVNAKIEEEENINGKAEESNTNVSKEEKTMRVFKIALVEFVKEILKPKWKEGQMSREVHKTIVKKTVDKVSSTIPGDQIPNTQEKISQYLSFSKGKITKLVQAYVERFLKTS